MIAVYIYIYMNNMAQYMRGSMYSSSMLRMLYRLRICTNYLYR